MANEATVRKANMLELTTEIVAAYCGNNTVKSGDIAGIIQSVNASIASLAAEATAAQEKLEPAVPINKSVAPDYLVCLEDGKKVRMLKRHLSTAHGMTLLVLQSALHGKLSDASGKVLSFTNGDPVEIELHFEIRAATSAISE